LLFRRNNSGELDAIRLTQEFCADDGIDIIGMESASTGIPSQHDLPFTVLV